MNMHWHKAWKNDFMMFPYSHYTENPSAAGM